MFPVFSIVVYVSGCLFVIVEQKQNRVLSFLLGCVCVCVFAKKKYYVLHFITLSFWGFGVNLLFILCGKLFSEYVALYVFSLFSFHVTPLRITSQEANL